MLICFRFEGVDRKEAVWKGLQTERSLGKEGREQIEKRERSCVQAEALPALCGFRLKSARRKQDVKDFQTPTRPLTER